MPFLCAQKSTSGFHQDDEKVEIYCCQHSLSDKFIASTHIHTHNILFAFFSLARQYLPSIMTFSPPF